MALDPVAVALKFGFLAVLYLFLFWMARSALKDLRRGAGLATGVRGRHRLHHATAGLNDAPAPARRSCGWRARPGCAPARPTTSPTARCSGAATRPTSGSRTRSRPPPTRGSSRQGDVIVLEDLGSTNGTYLNGEPLSGPQPLHDGDRIRIGDSEFTFER